MKSNDRYVAGSAWCQNNTDIQWEWHVHHFVILGKHLFANLFFVVNLYWSCVFEELILLNVDLAALDSQGAWPWHTVDTSGVLSLQGSVSKLMAWWWLAYRFTRIGTWIWQNLDWPRFVWNKHGPRWLDLKVRQPPELCRNWRSSRRREFPNVWVRMRFGLPFLMCFCLDFFACF